MIQAEYKGSTVQAWSVTSIAKFCIFGVGFNFMICLSSAIRKVSVILLTQRKCARREGVFQFIEEIYFCVVLLSDMIRASLHRI